LAPGALCCSGGGWCPAPCSLRNNTLHPPICASAHLRPWVL
jgi:hypothetical protein